MFDVERRVLELVYSKYVLKFRNQRVNKLIREKCREEYDKRKEIRNNLKVLKAKLLTEQDPKKILQIQNEIKRLEEELNKVEDSIKSKAKIELEIRERIKEKSREIDKELRKIFKGIISEESIKAVDQAIEQKDPELATIVILQGNEGLKPEPKVVEISPASVPGKEGGGG